MKAFWWFKENSIAGMARPGFNHLHWFDLPFEEALVFGWVGQLSSERKTVESLQTHIRVYGPKIAPFHGLDKAQFERIREALAEPKGWMPVLERVLTKTKSLQHFELNDGHISLTLSQARLLEEIQFLKTQGIQTIVTLTERHHQKDDLQEHFDTHHLAIDDLGPPKIEQVEHLASLIRQSNLDGTRLVVHCMAGIGRTSTMLIGAHLVLGESLDELKTTIAKRNPLFRFSGPQGEFLENLAADLLP